MIDRRPPTATIDRREWVIDRREPLPNDSAGLGLYTSPIGSPRRPFLSTWPVFSPHRPTSRGFRLSTSPVASPCRPTPRPNPTWKERQSRQCRENGGTGDRGRSGSAGRSAAAAEPGCPKKRVRPLTPIRKPYRYQVSPPSTPPSRNNADSLSPSRSSSSSTLSWCGGITCNHAACSRHAVCQGAALDAQLTKEEMSWE